MHRRRFLGLASAGTGLVAGCSGVTDGPTSTRTPTPQQERTQRRTTAESTGPTPSTGSDRDGGYPDAVFVDPDGSDGNAGGRDAPVQSVQEALDRAGPGTTVRLGAGVHTSGEVGRPVGITRRGGEPGRPITITGPPDAVVRGPEDPGTSRPLFHLTHSHVHLRGVTLDGLMDPNRPDEARWYRPTAVDCNPPTWAESYPDYLTDVVIAPSAVGNTGGKLVSTWRTNEMDIGGFEVTGPAGMEYYLADDDRYVLGAVVSLGRSPNNFGTSWYPWEAPDESNAICVHHVANLDGHAHTELVKTHSGNYDVTVEYCSDVGGATRESVRLNCGRSTVRWCDLRGSRRSGVHVVTPPMQENETYGYFESLPDGRFPGVNNAIYGNRLLDHERGGLTFSSPDWVAGGPDGQRVVCGNEVAGDSPPEAGQRCPADVPRSDTIGHLGGDSPWA